MSIIAERWLPIKGFDKYLVSNLGRVKSFLKCRGTNVRILKGSSMGAGYRKIHLSSNGRYTAKSVHRLVAEAFIPNDRTEADQINHKNSIKDDNRVENLEWVTRSENTIHAYENGHPRIQFNGVLNGFSKLTESDIHEIRRRKLNGEVQLAIARDFAIDPTTVSKIILRKAWKHLK